MLITVKSNNYSLLVEKDLLENCLAFTNAIEQSAKEFNLLDWLCNVSIKTPPMPILLYFSFLERMTFQQYDNFKCITLLSHILAKECELAFSNSPSA